MPSGVAAEISVDSVAPRASRHCRRHHLAGHWPPLHVKPAADICRYRDLDFQSMTNWAAEHGESADAPAASPSSLFASVLRAACAPARAHGVAVWPALDAQDPHLPQVSDHLGRLLLRIGLRGIHVARHLRACNPPPTLGQLPHRHRAWHNATCNVVAAVQQRSPEIIAQRDCDQSQRASLSRAQASFVSSSEVLCHDVRPHKLLPTSCTSPQPLW